MGTSSETVSMTCKALLMNTSNIAPMKHTIEVYAGKGNSLVDLKLLT